MYRMSESEFMQYETAARRLQELKRHHAIELQQAYDDIHPTRTGYNYDLGNVFSESINPADYAIYLVELREEHERLEKWWSIRAETYSKAIRFLSDEEKNNLIDYHYGSFRRRQTARDVLKKQLELIITTQSELQRQFIPLDDIEDLDEVDRRIDKMSMAELMEDYWDLEEAN